MGDHAPGRDHEPAGVQEYMYIYIYIYTHKYVIILSTAWDIKSSGFDVQHVALSVQKA